jgi:hypothetical protein
VRIVLSSCNWITINDFSIHLLLVRSLMFFTILARRLHTCISKEEVPVSMTVVYQLVRDTFRDWSDDKVPRMGAAIAYYSIFSMPPRTVWWSTPAAPLLARQRL